IVQNVVARVGHYEHCLSTAAAQFGSAGGHLLRSTRMIAPFPCDATLSAGGILVDIQETCWGDTGEILGRYWGDTGEILAGQVKAWRRCEEDRGTRRSRCGGAGGRVPSGCPGKAPYAPAR